MSVLSTQVRDPETYAIIGAAMEVHRELGSKFLEVVYKDALEIEFKARGIPFRREVELEVFYKGQLLPSYYRADFICFESIVIECKAIDALANPHRSQIINYLSAIRFHRGLLLNFGGESLQYERFVN